MGCDREQHSKTNVYGGVSYSYFIATFQLRQSTRSIVLAVKGCLDVFFVVFEEGLNLLVLLKGACFVVVVRLHICDSVWYRLARLNLSCSIHTDWRVC